MAAGIENRARFDFIRYANVWEDPDILCEALQPREGGRILSIASGGDNCFALLAEGAEVVGVDLNPAQLACVELKRAAIRELSHIDLLKFLGFAAATSTERREWYRQLEGALPDPSRAFWAANGAAIDEGFIHTGKFERYFQRFHKQVLPWIHRLPTVRSLFEERTLAEQRTFYDRRWNSWRWRMLFKIFFSRFLLGRLGRDPEFFRYVEGNVADRLLGRTEYAFTAIPTVSNPFLCYILTGSFTVDEIGAADLRDNTAQARMLPRYLRPDILPRVRENLDRLTLQQGTIQDVAHEMRWGGFSGFNLSDLFEYLSPALCSEIYRTLLAVSRSGARFAYWNMLVKRVRPVEEAERVSSLDELAGELFRRDRAFFYSAFVVEEVR